MPKGTGANLAKLRFQLFRHNNSSNTAALLHSHDHQRDIIPLGLPIRERGHLIQDALDDLLGCSTPTSAQ